MSIRLRYHVTTSISSSPADTKDLGNVCLDIVSDAPSEGGVWKTRIAAGADVTLPLDSISEAVFLMLRVIPADPTQVLTPVDITLNGTATIALAPVGSAREATFLISAEALTSLEIANNRPGAVDVDVMIGTAGD